MATVGEIMSEQITGIINYQALWPTFLSEVNVMYPPIPMLGAKGDGVTNDTAAIQNIINAVKLNQVTNKNGAGVIFFPGKVFKFSSLSIIRNATDAKEFNITLRGTNGTILAADKTAATALTIKGYDPGYFDPNTVIRRVFIENLQIRGDYLPGTGAIVGAGIELTLAQNCPITNVLIKGFSAEGFLMRQGWDCPLLKVEIDTCGRANSATDFCYAVRITKYYDNSNANKFTDCRFEICPLMLFMDFGARENTFRACKFEHGGAGLGVAFNKSGQAPIAIADVMSAEFSGCMFVKNSQSEEPFIVVNNAQFSYNSMRKSVKFIGNEFAASNGIRVRWFKLNYCEIENNTFNQTSGASGGPYPFQFGEHVNFTSNRVIIATVDTATFHITGDFNQIDSSNTIEYVGGGTPGYGAFLKMDAGVNDNFIGNFGVIGTPYAVYDIAYPYLGSNVIMRRPGYVHRGATTSLAWGAEVLVFAQTAPTTISEIKFGHNGKTVTVIADLTQITMENNATIKTKSGSNLILQAGKAARFTNYNGVWYEV